MRKIKWGNDFNFFPATQLISDRKYSFNQGAQAVVLGDYVRVYYSSRLLDESGNYESHVFFADIEPVRGSIKRVSSSPVISLGALGTYYEHGIFPFHVHRNGNRWLAYITGWSRRIAVPVETAIGLAESFDEGETFQHLGTGPILAANQMEPFLICDANVTYVKGTFHMWYLFGTSWSHNQYGKPERTYKIGHASSKDGLKWIRENPGKQIVTSHKISEAQAMPSVLSLADNFNLMVFCYRDTFDFRHGGPNSYRLGAAISNDLQNWERDDSIMNMNFPNWASQMQCYPNLVLFRGSVLLFFNGNDFGKEGFGLISGVIEE